MSNAQLFTEVMQKWYQFKSKFVKIGCGILNGETVPETNVYLPLKTLNRHGLIASATGTGKTKTL